MSPWSLWSAVAVPLAAATTLASGGCGNDVALTDARPQIDAAVPGQIALGWSLAHGGAPLTCADVGASTVSVDLVHDGDAFGVVDAFTCDDATGTTRRVQPGLYHLRMSVSGVGGILDGPHDVADQTVPPGGIVTAPAVAFDVDPIGGLTFRITTPLAGNCSAVADGGAGITALRIELRDHTGACVPASFTVGAGATLPAGTYASDCIGSTYGCIAADQDVAITGLRSGSYSMVMTGAVGAAACWRREPNAVVPAAGHVADLPAQQLVLATGVPGCPTT